PARKSTDSRCVSSSIPCGSFRAGTRCSRTPRSSRPNGEFDRGDYILQKRGHWRVIWSVVGGGSSTCRDLSAYYLGAIRHLTKHGVEPESLAPALAREHRRLSACDPEENEPGDMGPAI